MAAIVVTANQVDIDAGKLAKSKAQSQDVQAFAQRMITDHSAVNKSATDLVQKLHVIAQLNPTSESLQKGGDQNLATLKGLTGSTFDKVYIDHEVAYHEGAGLEIITADACKGMLRESLAKEIDLAEGGILTIDCGAICPRMAAARAVTIVSGWQLRGGARRSGRSGQRVFLGLRGALQPCLEFRVTDKLGRAGEDPAAAVEQGDQQRVLEFAAGQPPVAQAQ